MKRSLLKLKLKIFISKLPSLGVFAVFLENLNSDRHSHPRRYSLPFLSAKTVKIPSFIYYDRVMSELKIEMKGIK